MAKVLVIGYGSTIRSDDGLGVIAAGRLTETLQDEETEIITRHQLTPELMLQLAEASLVIFIDATAEGTPGEVRGTEIHPDPTPPPTMCHHLSPATLLSCTHALYGRAPRGLIFSVCGKSFDFGDSLSPEVEAALPALVERIRAAYLDFCKDR